MFADQAEEMEAAGIIWAALEISSDDEERRQKGIRSGWAKSIRIVHSGENAQGKLQICHRLEEYVS
jgi:hypothetical protein